jgi:hypothetical protein
MKIRNIEIQIGEALNWHWMPRRYFRQLDDWNKTHLAFLWLAWWMTIGFREKAVLCDGGEGQTK